MKSFFLLLLGICLVHCQIETPIESPIETPTPTISEPLSPIEPVTETSSSIGGITTPTTPIEEITTTTSSTETSISSDDTTITTESSTLSEEITSTTSSSLTTSAPSNSTSTSLDDDEEITTTGTIAPENTNGPELAEATVIPRELTPSESVDATALDIETYADLLVNSPLPDAVDGDGEVTEAIALPACPVSKDQLDKRQLFGSRPKRPKFYPCTPQAIDVPIVYRYVPDNQKTTEEKALLSSRVAKQHEYFKNVMGEYGITFSGDTTLRFMKATPSAAAYTKNFFSFSDTPEANARRAEMASYQKKIRVGGPDTLNVWIVNSIESDDATLNINGYAPYPQNRAFDTDGIVLNINALRFDDDKVALETPRYRGVTLIHEFGHWMGLPHTFGDSDCTEDDGISDTWQTSDNRDTRGNNYQDVCNRPDLDPIWVSNYMSYSRSRGTYRDKLSSVRLKSFTKGQRAVMFSRFFAFRLGAIYRAQFCETTKLKARAETPAEYHAFQKRAEDKAAALADLLLSNCSVAIQDVYQEDSIPLPSSALASYSSAASVKAANPTQNENPFAPKTATIGTGTSAAVPTNTGSGGSGGNGGSGGGDKSAASSSMNVMMSGQVAVIVSMMCWTLLALF